VATQFPSAREILYATSIAVISFVGLESISQAAQETIRPSAVIPRTSLALIVVVLLFAMAFPIVTLGIVPWQEIASREGIRSPTWLINCLSSVFLAGPVAAILAATIVLISANTGVMGCSRLAYSMADMGLIGRWLSHVHPKFHTPVRAIVVFSAVAALEAIVGFLTGKKALETIANMYASAPCWPTCWQALRWWRCESESPTRPGPTKFRSIFVGAALKYRSPESWPWWHVFDARHRRVDSRVRPRHGSFVDAGMGTILFLAPRRMASLYWPASNATGTRNRWRFSRTRESGSSTRNSRSNWSVASGSPMERED